jgi:hypothetical protein
MARRRLPAALIVLLLALVAVLAGCGGGGGVPVAAPTTLDALASSATRSAAASTGRFTFSMEMAIPGFADGFRFTGEGAYDSQVGKTQMSLDLSSLVDTMKGMAEAFGGDAGAAGLNGDDFKLEVVVDGLVMYMRMPFIADKLPGGKEWVKVDLRDVASKVPGVDLDQFLQFANNSPQTTLEYLKAVSGPIETVGVEDVRGTQTTRYRTSIDVAKMAKVVPAAQRETLSSMLDQLVKQTGLGSIPVDVWVGDDGLVRRLVMTLSMTEPGGSDTLTASMTFEMFDYGKPVHITLPLAADTADITALTP